MNDKLAEQYRESQRELYAENERLRAEIKSAREAFISIRNWCGLKNAGGSSVYRENKMDAIAAEWLARVDQ